MVALSSAIARTILSNIRKHIPPATKELEKKAIEIALPKPQ